MPFRNVGWEMPAICHVGKTDGFQAITVPDQLVTFPATPQIIHPQYFSYSGGTITVQTEGLYKFTCRGYFSGASTTCISYLDVTGWAIGDCCQDTTAVNVLYDGQTHSTAVGFISALGTIKMRVTSSAAGQSVYGANGWNGTFMEVEYLGWHVLS